MKQVQKISGLSAFVIASLHAAVWSPTVSCLPSQAAGQQKEGTECRSEEPSDPMRDIATWAKMDEAQRKRLDDLLIAVSSFNARSGDRQRKVEALRAELLANASDPVRADTSLISNIGATLASVLTKMRLDVKTRRRLTRDLWAIMNVDRTRSVASSAVGSIHNHLTNSGAKAGSLGPLTELLNTVLKNQFNKDWGRKVQ